MISPSRPIVLVVERDPAASGRIARMLEESGIAVVAAADGAAALAAASRRRYDLAIVTTSLAGALGETGMIRELRERQPGLELLFLAETAADGVAGAGTAAARAPQVPCPRDPRRFVGRVRERLLWAHPRPPGPREEAQAEFAVAAAKIACLRRRRAAARRAGAGGLADELCREIAETAAIRAGAGRRADGR